MAALPPELPPTDDPAHRLWELLSRLLNDAPQTDRPIGDVLVELTGEPSAARAISALLVLLERTEAGLWAMEAQVPDVHAHITLLTPIDEWLSALDLRQAWHSAPPLSGYAVTALLACSAQLRNQEAVVALSDDQVESLRAETAELLNDVLASDELPDELIEFLVQSLHGMQHLLDHYKARGSVGLLDEIKRQLGNYGAKLPETKKDHKLWQRFVALCANATIAVTGVTSVAHLTAQTATNVRHVYGVLVEADKPEPPKGLPSGEKPALTSGASPQPREKPAEK